MVYSKEKCQSEINSLEIKPGNIVIQDGEMFLIKSINPIRSRTVIGSYEIGFFCVNVRTDKMISIVYTEDVVPSAV